MNTEVQEATESLDRFFRGIAPQAKRYAMAMTHQWGEAEELVQEACFRMTRAEGTQHGDSPAGSRKAYLFRTIRNLVIDRQRASQRQPHTSADLDRLVANPRASAASQAASLGHLEAAVEAICAELPSNWSDALKLKLNAKLSYLEIADVLQATPDQVRGWIYRARKELARRLKEKGLMETDE